MLGYRGLIGTFGTMYCIYGRMYIDYNIPVVAAENWTENY